MDGSGYRASIRRCSLRLLLLLLCSALPGTAPCEEPPAASPPPPENSLPQTLVSRSPGGRFSVSGTNRLEILDLMRWAEAMATRVETTLNLKLPPVGRPIRITILPPGTNEADSVTSHERYDAQGLLQWLLIAGYDTAPVTRVQEELVRLLLANLMPDRRTPATAQRPDGIIPNWFIAAVIHNLNAESRDRDYLQVYDAWRMGSLPSLPDHLAQNWKPDAPPENAPISALLLQWILDVSDSKPCLDLLWLRFRNGTPITPDDLLPFIPGVSSATSLDQAWDNWLLKQRRRVRNPGQPSAQALEELKAQLLLYPGDSAIGISDEAFQPLTLRDLIKQREKAWVPAAAAGKAIRLRLLAAGRDEGFRDVVNAYGAFLDALAKQRKERILTEQLEIAEKKLNAYEERAGTLAPPESNKRKETP